MAHTTDPLPLNPHAQHTNRISKKLNPHAAPFHPHTHHLTKHSSTLNIGHINIRSLRHKLCEVESIMIEQQLDILAVSETWLDNSVSDLEVHIRGTILYRRDRPCMTSCSCLTACGPCKKGGGVCLYVKETLRVSLDERYSHDALELLCIRCTPQRGSEILIGCIYRPPGQSVDYWDSLAAAVDCADCEELYLLGDLNVNFLDKQSSTYKALYHTILLPLNLSNLVNAPTRITRQTQTSIDCILTNSEDATTASVFDCEFSDHRIITTSVPITSLQPDTPDHKPRQPSRDYSSFCMQEFHKLLKSVSLHSFSSTNPHQMAAEWVKKFNCALDELAPIVSRRAGRPTSKERCPFMTEELLHMIRQRKSAFRRLKASAFQDPVTALQFRQLRTRSNNLYRQLRNKYFSELCQDYEQSPRKFWSAINGVTKRKPAKPKTSVEAETLNRYFHSIVHDPDASYNVPLGPVSSTDLESFASVTIAEVELLLLDLKPRKAPGPDNILPCLVKSAAYILAPSLAILFNASFSSGILPSTFKEANICPVLKSQRSDRSDPSQYRPISLSSVIAKALEKVVLRQLQQLFDDKCPYHKDQYGFRRHHSTAQLVTKAVSQWTASRDTGHTTMIVFLDLSKAFDRVNHQCLLISLQAKGIGRTALAWFASYLYDRRQKVTLQHATSRVLPVSRGVPQGTVLGPVLFNVYISHLPTIADSFTCSLPMFADDMTLYRSAPSLKLCIASVIPCLNVLCDELQKLHMMINVKKSGVMIISPG